MSQIWEGFKEWEKDFIGSDHVTAASTISPLGMQRANVLDVCCKIDQEVERKNTGIFSKKPSVSVSRYFALSMRSLTAEVRFFNCGSPDW